METIKNLSRKSHKKFNLFCHLIFSTKYRKSIFSNVEINAYLKTILTHKFKQFKIIISETDKNHIHFMISYEPEIAISKIVQQLKSYTTFHLWKQFNNVLRCFYWKDKVIWTKGYFVCSIGNSNPETIQNYITNQG